MSSMKNLVEPECGGSNTIVKTSRHFTSDQLAQRGLSHHPGHSGPLGPHSGPQLSGRNAFDMRHLLHDIQQNEAPQVVRVIPHVKPNLTAGQWSDEFASQCSPLSASGSMTNQALRGNHAAPLIHDSTRSSHHQSTIVSPMFSNHLSRPLLAGHIHAPPSFIASGQDGLLKDSSSVEYKLAGDILQEQETKLERKEAQDAANHSAILDEARKLLDSVVQEPSLKSKFEEAAERILKKESSQVQDVSNDGEKDDLAFWNKLASEWEANALESDSASSWLGNYDTVSDPFKDGYFFKDDNPLRETVNAFEEGLKKLNEGDIPSAVLLFEAACQQDPENNLAWQYLGTTQAKNEHDPAAIRALRRALQLDPNDLTSLMALAVSYTNEAYQKQACDSLLDWLTRNPAYKHLSESITHQEGDGDSPETRFVSSFASPQKIQQIKDAFIRAARMKPSNPDPDVQSGLGVLFNLSGEYDKAVDCFNSALFVRPMDALLWNRLGATLANGNRSEEAIQAYRKALEISPGFIRCRFNLGISCVNLGVYNEAVEHFLAVLNFQNAGRGAAGETSRTAMSNNVWSSLRLVLSLANRQDLYPAVESKDLTKLNHEFKMDDFLHQLNHKD